MMYIPFYLALAGVGMAVFTIGVMTYNAAYVFAWMNVINVFMGAMLAAVNIGLAWNAAQEKTFDAK